MPDIPQFILDRLQAQEPIFTADEVAAWPDGLLDQLLADGVLEPTDNAGSVTCDACGHDHVEAVEYIQSPPDTKLRAYIACPEAGRVRVPLDRLRRWIVNGEKLGAPKQEPSHPDVRRDGCRTAIVGGSTGPTESEAVREISKVTVAKGQDSPVLQASGLPPFPIPTNYSELFKLFAAKVACGSPHECVGLAELNRSVGAEESPRNSERASAPLRTAIKRLNDELSQWAPRNDQGPWIGGRRGQGYYLAESVEWHIGDPGLEKELRRYSQSVWGISVAPATLEENTPLRDQRLPAKPRHVSPPDEDD